MNSISIHTIFLSILSKHMTARDKLLSAMYVSGIPAKLVNMCRLTLTDTKSLFKVHGEKSESFITTKGFRHGDGRSCDLFNICLIMIIRAAYIDTTCTVYNKALQILGYADDTAVNNIVGATDEMGLK